MIFGLLLWFTASFGLQESINMQGATFFRNSPVYAELTVHAENEWLDIYGSYRNEMKVDKWDFGFIPEQDFHIIGVSLFFEGFTLNYEHMSKRPVSSLLSEYKGTRGGYNKIEISFSSK